MSFQVKTPTFTGPFDLFLSLVQKEKVSITEVNIAHIADQYFEEMKNIEEVDLEVASDFVFVAATLLMLKSGHLLPIENDFEDQYLDEVPLSQDEALQFLVDRLARYRTYREAAKSLRELEVNAKKMLGRCAPLSEEFKEVQPDHLGSTTLFGFCAIAAHIFSRKPKDLLDSKHIAKKYISLSHATKLLLQALESKKSIAFSKLIGKNASTEEVVVNFLALLDLIRQGKAEVMQTSAFKDIAITCEV